jgi:hypothetical protein
MVTDVVPRTKNSLRLEPRSEPLESRPVTLGQMDEILQFIRQRRQYGLPTDAVLLSHPCNYDQAYEMYCLTLNAPPNDCVHCCIFKLDLDLFELARC